MTGQGSASAKSRGYPVAPTGQGQIAPRVREVFARARDPQDAAELCRLYIGAVESDLGAGCLRPDAAAHWRGSKPLREISDQEILSSRSTVRWIKYLFNHYFRDDLYGVLRRDDTIILSSGSLDESIYGLPASLKRTIATAMDRDWYGYSDSRGRRATRQAIAALENAQVAGSPYDQDWIAVTMGGTSAIACLADFVLGGAAPSGSALCVLPNYPPLVEAVARRAPVELVSAATEEGFTDITNVIDSVRPSTPLVLVQTATNPTGTRIPEHQIARLIRAVAPSTIIVLDEAHECFSGSLRQTRCAERAWPNVIRVASLSKTHAVPGMKLGWIVAHPDVMREYYEYASTSYGGPPSLFYLMVEMAARFEAWAAANVDVPSERILMDFEASYNFTLGGLLSEYLGYLAQRRESERRIAESRGGTLAALSAAGCDPFLATHSINVAFRPPACASSYVWFRRCLSATNVACFPGILTFVLRDDSLRITVGRRADELAQGTRQIISFSGAG
jgi:aspartate/methionine/tyrosine aminotransferase